MAYSDQRAPQFTNQHEAPAVTLESLLRHFKKYGLENAGKGTARYPARYATYAQLRRDALVHVGRTFLGENAYVHLLESIGHDGHGPEARTDWRELHNGQA